jgi:hypothetical protein
MACRKLLLQRKIRWFRLSFVLSLMILLCSFSGRRIHLGVSSLQLSGSVSLSSSKSSSSTTTTSGGGCYSTTTIRSTSFLSTTTAQVFNPHVLLYQPPPPPMSYFSYSTTTTRFVTIVMVKDGKQKRKKQDNSAASSSPATPAVPQTPAAPRVSNGINVPIRRQIAYGKLNKQFRETSSASFRQTTNPKKKMERTKYRRTWGTLLYFTLRLEKTATSSSFVFGWVCPLTHLALFYIGFRRRRNRTKGRRTTTKGTRPGWGRHFESNIDIPASCEYFGKSTFSPF